jgi:hypothetical protein
MIKKPATILKCDLVKTHAHRGKGNAAPVTIDGTEYPVGSLRFCGFSGHGVERLPDGQLPLIGVLQFEQLSDAGQAALAEWVAFTEIPGFTGQEVTDVV